MYLTGKWIKKVETLRDLEKEIKYLSVKANLWYYFSAILLDKTS